VFAVNVRGLFQVTRACAGRLRAARGRTGETIVIDGGYAATT
jgi:NAD(P)-dependent dehydrogenase (short-subunit alcohol dehydrogenase family)